jgi:uncharacterized protein YndB with AHSA1/START domain
MSAMANYRFITTSAIAVPVERVWPEVSQPDRWATWWPGLVGVKVLEPGDREGRGALLELRFKSRLPYTLSLRSRITRVEPHRRMDIEAQGELEGIAVYELEHLGATTRMRLTWTVRTTKTWMNLLAPVARPLFAWNHDVLMKAGMRGLARKLNGDVVLFEAGHPLRRLMMFSSVVVGALWLWKRSEERVARGGEWTGAVPSSSRRKRGNTAPLHPSRKEE